MANRSMPDRRKTDLAWRLEHLAWVPVLLCWCLASACSVDDRVVSSAVLSARQGSADAAGVPSPGVVSSGAPLGSACAAASECASGFCADGVCCDTGCADVCASCAAPGTEGTCSPIPSDPLCSALSCPAGTECRAIDTTQAGANCEQIGVCRASATCQITNAAVGTACQNGTGSCDGNGACTVVGKLPLATSCTSGDECAEGYCANNGSTAMCCDAPCDAECQQCSPSGHCDAAPALDPRCPTVTCPPSNVCRQYSGDLSGACHGYGACATVTDCAYTELRSAADCSCDAQGRCTLSRGKECQSDAECVTGACVPLLGGGTSVCCASACADGSACAGDGSGCVECAGNQVVCEGTTELRCQADGHFSRSDCPFGCTQGQGCNPLPGLGFVCDVATGCQAGLPCQADATGVSRCCARDCAAEARVCAENGSCACPPDQVTSGAACLLHVGDPCTQPAECESGQCVDGVCCGEACGGACEQCQVGTGACVAIAAGQQDDLCTGAQQCTGTRGDCRSTLGQACTAGADCASSNCQAAIAGGQLCCATSCGAGTSCSSDGQRCVQCEPTAASACGNGCNADTFTCNALRPVGSPCGSSQQCAAPGQCLVDSGNVSRCCEANCAASGRVCDASGGCVCPAGQSELNGRCVSPPGQACTDDAGCSTAACALVVGGGRKCCARACTENELCAPDGSACIDQRGAPGAPCSTGGDCQNGNCVNDVCCAGACGPCQRCQQATGMCQPNPSASCTLASGAPGTCTAGECTDPGAGPGQLCGARQCQEGLVCTAAGVCCNSECDGACESACSNGQGACNMPATDSRCGQTACPAGVCQQPQPRQLNRSCVAPGVCAAAAADQCDPPTAVTGGACTTTSGEAGRCEAGSCQRLPTAAGLPCATGGECESGTCSGGVCCTQACDECQVCAAGSGACSPVDDQTPCGALGANRACFGGVCTATVSCNGAIHSLSAADVCCEVLGDAAGLREEVRAPDDCRPSNLDVGGLTLSPITCDQPQDCPSGQICCLRSVAQSNVECMTVEECEAGSPTLGSAYRVCGSPSGFQDRQVCTTGTCSPNFLAAFLDGWLFCQ